MPRKFIINKLDIIILNINIYIYIGIYFHNYIIKTKLHIYKNNLNYSLKNWIIFLI